MEDLGDLGKNWKTGSTPKVPDGLKILCLQGIANSYKLTKLLFESNIHEYNIAQS